MTREAERSLCEDRFCAESQSDGSGCRLEDEPLLDGPDGELLCLLSAELTR